MNKKNFLFGIIILFSFNLFSQDTGAAIVKDAPNVFFKCFRCDMVRMKRELNYINYVNQRQDADIVVIVTNQGTGTGEKFFIYFEGQSSFSGVNDTLEVSISNTETESVIADKIIASIKKGLLQYIIKTPVLDRLNYSINGIVDKEAKDEIDPWNYWVFSTGLRGNFNGESSYNYFSFNGSFRASRVTEENKWRFYLSTNISQRNYFFYDSNNVKIDTLTISSERKSNYASGSYVKSLNDHWSAGVFSSIYSNTYSNYNLNMSLKLGVEYNFFNFEESDRKSIVLSYKIGGSYNDYVDTTIYNKLKENLLSQSIGLSIYQKQKWGNVKFGANYFNYLHNTKLNSLTFNTNISWNIVKGVTLSGGGYLAFVNDQVNLSKEKAGVIGTVLGDRLLATNYNAYTYFGIRYTFGSKYANAVNPRFNSGGSSVTYYFF